MSPSLTTSSISRKDISGLISFASYSTNLPSACAFCCRQTRNVRFMCSCSSLLVTPLRHPHLFVDERLLVQHRILVYALELPGRDKGELLVIAQRLAIPRLVLLAEMAAARLLAHERVV